MIIVIILGLVLLAGIVNVVSQEMLNRRLIRRIAALEAELGIDPDGKKVTDKK